MEAIRGRPDMPLGNCEENPGLPLLKPPILWDSGVLSWILIDQI